MGMASANVDNASIGEKNVDQNGFDCFASQNEEWIIRLQNLREDEEELLRGVQCDANGNGDDSTSAAKGRIAATRTILHTARLANLQCASAAYRDKNCGRRTIAEIDRLSLHVQQSFDTEGQHHKSILEYILCGANPESSNSNRDASQSILPFPPETEDLCTSIEVDAFFNDYPECCRTIQEDIDCFSDSDTESGSGGEDEKIQTASRRRKRPTISSQELVSMTVEAASEPLETQQGERTQTQQQAQAQFQSKAQAPTPKDHLPEHQSRQDHHRKEKHLSANNNHGNIDSSSSNAIKNPYANRNPSNMPQHPKPIPRGQDSGSAIDLFSSTTNNDSTYNKYNAISQGVNLIENNRFVAQGSNRQSFMLPSNGNNRGGERSNQNNNTNHQRHNDPNPYRRSSSQNKPQSNSQAYGNNFHGQEDSTSNDAWRDHRNQTNPFQTAREVALAEETHPHRDPFRNRGGEKRDGENRARSQNQNSYGQEFQGRTNNPFDNLNNGENAAVAPNGGPFIPESLKRRYQNPKRGLGQGGASNSNAASNRSHPRPSSNTMNNGGSSSQRSSGANFGGQTDQRKSNEPKAEEDELPEELQHLDKELVKKIQNEIQESGDTITFDDIAGLADAKKTVQEVVCWPMKRPDLFTGLRRAPNGLLLYGPPG